MTQRFEIIINIGGLDIFRYHLLGMKETGETENVQFTLSVCLVGVSKRFMI
jgi:hypothetical protein